MAEADTAYSTRLVCGALAGFVAAAPMTALMHRGHRKLASKDRYPLPPREIVGSVAPALDREAATNMTLVAHFAYGGLCGAALASIIRKPTVGDGILGGLSVWLASYLGWIPAFGILKPATGHPRSRNGLMTVAHVVWGTAFAITQRDLLKSQSAFAEGSLKDAARPESRGRIQPT